ncbi:MAG: alpha-L-rhamnosidase C-terminal domain-containing protein, partial [Spirochaetota bacterium]
CPSREQRQWTGDTYIQSLLNYVTDGDTRLVRKMLLQSAQTQRSDGMIMMASTSDLQADARTYIPDYSLSWILATERYVLHTGDSSILTGLFPSISKAIAWFLPYLNADGLLSDVPGWVFIDWSDRLDKRGEVLALNAMFAQALDAAARIAGLVEASSYARSWKTMAASLRATAAEAFWDEARGLYVDARSPDGLSATVSQQGNAAAIAFGIAPVERWDRIFAAILDEDRLKLTRTWRWDKERPFDPEKDIVLAQPYFSHFLHLALAKAGRVGDIVSNIKRRWSPMLKEGNTFRESWQLTEMTSRCHAFSATPTWDISSYVLGVSALADGYSRFKVCPYFTGLDWARGTVPTPAGMIQVAWQQSFGTLEITVTVPDRLSGILEVSVEGEPVKVFDLAPGNNSFSLPSSTGLML